MLSQTQIILIVVAVLVIVVLFLRSKREERRAREKESNLRKGLPDVLLDSQPRSDERQEPELDFTSEKEQTPVAMAPSEEPPLYTELEQERQAKKEEIDAAVGVTQAEPIGQGLTLPPVDDQVEWVAEIVPRTDIALGRAQAMVSRLHCELQDMSLAIWARSTRDGNYYSAEALAAPTNHVVVAMVLANRSCSLNNLQASRFVQAIERVGIEFDADIRDPRGMERALADSGNITQLIAAFDKTLRVRLVADEPNTSYTLEDIAAVVKAAGFTLNTARSVWELRHNPAERDAYIFLGVDADDPHSLVLMLDMPLASQAAGDLRKFFAIANDIACHLNAAWCDWAYNPFDARSAGFAEKEFLEFSSNMIEKGIEPGSDRAKHLFAR